MPKGRGPVFSPGLNGRWLVIYTASRGGLSISPGPKGLWLVALGVSCEGEWQTASKGGLFKGEGIPEVVQILTGKGGCEGFVGARDGGERDGFVRRWVMGRVVEG